MTTSKLPETPLKTANTDTLSLWWYQPWGEAINSAVKLQCIWLETCNDAARHELEFFSTMATSYSKLTHCMLGLGELHTLASVACCYHEIGNDMTEATLKRTRMVSELSDDFIERIWCETEHLAGAHPAPTSGSPDWPSVQSRPWMSDIGSKA